MYSGRLCFRHYLTFGVREGEGGGCKGDGSPAGGQECAATTAVRLVDGVRRGGRPMSVCDECRAAVQTAKLAEVCLVRGLSEAVEAFLQARLPVLPPSCCFQASAHDMSPPPCESN